MTGTLELSTPLPTAGFGGLVRLAEAPGDANALVAAAEAAPETLPHMLAEAGGVLALQGLGGISDDPMLLLRLSRLFGPEVEDYRRTLTALNMVHGAVPEIFIVSNVPPVKRAPPKRPEPPLTADGRFPVQYPQRSGWHTDQSYRRPPPDISLFYCKVAAPRDQAQTLFADGTAAYAALPADLKARVDGLEALHVKPHSGRTRADMLAGATPGPQEPLARSQRQPVVRAHPVTGRPALYLCESSQLDWFEGPFVGLEPGPHGEGAALLDALMTHYTRPEFVYVHEWTAGDLVVWDNRCTVHTATWFDADHVDRVMWRTTVRGNPGALYDGEARSWLPPEAAGEAAAAE